MTNADKFKSLFGLYATELWAMPEKDFLKWLNSEAMNCSEFPNNSDTISRQAAIDIERNATVDTNPSHFEAHQKFTQFLDDAEISSFGRWQWSNGFNTALTAVGIDLRRLPPAQPERKTGKWIDEGFYADGHGAHAFRCSECGGHIIEYDTDPFCKWCGTDMRTKETDYDYERAVEQLEHDMLYEPTFNQDDGSM